jgi:ribosomal protein S18 acetylase RimI-like enzyme
MPITYRDTHDVDLDDLARLFTAVGMGDRAADRARLAQQVMGSRFVVSAWDGSTLVGFARAISDGATNAYVSTVAVLPAYQRRGIGRGMMQQLMAGRDGLTFALHAAEGAGAFYLACGFDRNPDMYRRLRKL